MGQPACLLAPTRSARAYPTPAPAPRSDFAFRSLVLAKPHSLRTGRGMTLAASIVLHAVLLAAALLVPLLYFEDALPSTDTAVRAFFAAPPELAPAPPPPPPPPAATVRARVSRAPAPVPSAAPRFVAPVEAPEQMPIDEGIDVGVEGGVPGGVEGGVPGGVVGGIIGGLPPEAPPAPRAIVRVGGMVRAPKLVHQVKPVYPVLAAQARIAGMVIVEAHVGVDGRVRSARVLRGNPVLDPAALEAVQQWRYQPLLLNGEPTEFILTVTLNFELVRALASASGR